MNKIKVLIAILIAISLLLLSGCDVPEYSTAHVEHPAPRQTASPSSYDDDGGAGLMMVLIYADAMMSDGW